MSIHSIDFGMFQVQYEHFKKDGGPEEPPGDGQMEARVANLEKTIPEIRERLARIETKLDSVDRSFGTVDKRFDAVDKRFEAVDKRFDAVDNRFEAVDKRFDAVDNRFETVDKRFDAVDKRFDAVEERMATKTDLEVLRGSISTDVQKSISDASWRFIQISMVLAGLAFTAAKFVR